MKKLYQEPDVDIIRINVNEPIMAHFLSNGEDDGGDPNTGVTSGEYDY